ncbi:MAG TPA: hypothetical protein VHG35_04300 [Gemmatimonadales bacterium]|nr:hypothetical protein [Gemmatimonadales bacterium]
MGTSQGVTDRTAVLSSRALERRRDHRFFTGMALAAALTAFIGFAPSYYLRTFSEAPPLRTLVHLHGVAATAWMLLFVGQTSLVSAGRTDLHRRLGIAGVVVATLFVVVGYATSITAARLGVTPPGGPPPLAFLAVPLGTLLSFAVLAAMGLSLRRDRDTHRRLMLLATIAILPPAFARMRWLGAGGPPVAISGTCLFVLTCLAYDRAAHGRIHPAFLWGGLLLMLSLPARFALTRSDAWLSLAARLTGTAP